MSVLTLLDALMRVTAATKEETRQRIIAAAVERFKAQGFDAATTRDIAREAQLAVGTLFNYFPTKESIVEYLIGQACARAEEAFDAASKRDAMSQEAEPRSLEEELFAHVAAALRKLKPYRKYLPAVLESSLSPLSTDQAGTSLRAAHLEIVNQIASRHGQNQSLSAVALQLYWTLFTGVLAFWAKDASPRQEDTLALLDQSLAMFVGWLTANAGPTESLRKGG